MNTNGVSNIPLGQSAATPEGMATSNDKRLQLQALLLRRSLNAQQTQTIAQANEAQGKGQILDLRV